VIGSYNKFFNMYKVESKLNMTRKTFTRAEAEAIALMVELTGRNAVVKVEENKEAVLIWADYGLDIIFAKLLVLTDNILSNLYVFQRESGEYDNPFPEERANAESFSADRYLRVVKNSTVVDINQKL